MSKMSAQDWGTNDDTENGCLEETKPDNKGYESDPTDKPLQVALRAPLSNLFTQEGKWFRKTVNRKEDQPYIKTLGGKPI